MSGFAQQITPEILIRAYGAGIFPMADGRDAQEMFWVDPDERGILPLDQFHIPKKLARTVRRQPFEVRVDSAFQQVVEACAAPARGRHATWISREIETLYTELFNWKFAHCVECWKGDYLVGGLYGVSLGGAFFGESMFHRETDASKVALVYLIARLKAGGYRLLDTQFVTDHLVRFGAIEIPRRDYHRRLRHALEIEGDFYSLASDASPSTVLQLSTQTS